MNIFIYHGRREMSDRTRYYRMGKTHRTFPGTKNISQRFSPYITKGKKFSSISGCFQIIIILHFELGMQYLFTMRHEKTCSTTRKEMARVFCVSYYVMCPFSVSKMKRCVDYGQKKLKVAKLFFTNIIIIKRYMMNPKLHKYSKHNTIMI